MTLELQVLDLNTYLKEIFGEQPNLNAGLIFKNLPQRIKYNLRKLGKTIIEEQKVVAEQFKALQDEYFTEEFEKEDGTKDRRIPEDKFEEFKTKVDEINNTKVSVECANFEEDDFEDQRTGKMVGDENIYYNIIERILNWEV